MGVSVVDVWIVTKVCHDVHGGVIEIGPRRCEVEKKTSAKVSSVYEDESGGEKVGGEVGRPVGRI